MPERDLRTFLHTLHPPQPQYPYMYTHLPTILACTYPPILQYLYIDIHPHYQQYPHIQLYILNTIPTQYPLPAINLLYTHITTLPKYTQNTFMLTMTYIDTNTQNAHCWLGKMTSHDVSAIIDQSGIGVLKSTKRIDIGDNVMTITNSDIFNK